MASKRTQVVLNHALLILHVNYLDNGSEEELTQLLPREAWLTEHTPVLNASMQLGPLALKQLQADSCARYRRLSPSVYADADDDS